MGKIDRFLAKKVEVTIGGESYMLRPFTVQDLPLLTKLGSKEETVSSKATRDVVKKVMNQVDSEATDEQMNQVSMEFLEDIMNAVSKINGIDIDEAKAKLLEKQNAGD